MRKYIRTYRNIKQYLYTHTHTRTQTHTHAHTRPRPRDARARPDPVGHDARRRDKVDAQVDQAARARADGSRRLLVALVRIPLRRIPTRAKSHLGIPT